MRLGTHLGPFSISERIGGKIAPATYYEHRGRKATAREVGDAELKPKIATVHAANYGVYGARKVWLTLNRERPADAPPIARCTVERLMGELELRGAVRGKVKRTTISDPKAAKPHDLLDRNFSPLAPDRLWVADFTYVSTWSGWCYTAFVIDAYARRIPPDPGLVGGDHDDQPARPRIDPAKRTIQGWNWLQRHGNWNPEARSGPSAKRPPHEVTHLDTRRTRRSDAPRD